MNRIAPFPEVEHQRLLLADGLALDCGVSIRPVAVAFRTYGRLNAARTNAILVCHALTGDQYVAETQPVTGKPGWWDVLVGPGLGLVTATEQVALLAAAKARAVAERETDALVVGADSLLEFRGQPLGKPADVHDARDRWQRMSGKSGVLHTGQALFDVRAGQVVSRDVAVVSTVVHFASPTPQEIEAYLATGEPLAVAGGFTLDGLGAPFVRRVDGDPAAVVGLSLAMLRTQLGRRGLAITDLWRR